MLDSMVRLGALVRHNTRLLLSEPGPLLSRLVLPLLFIMLLHPLYVAAQGEVTGTRQIVAGSLVTFSLLALSVVGTGIVSERIWGTLDRVRVTAAHPAEILAGKALPIMVALLVQQVLVLTFGVVVYHLAIADIALLVPVLLCWTFALLAIGALLGVLVRSLSELALGYDIGGMLLSSLGGALAPLTSMPQWLQEIAPVSPGYWAMRGLLGVLRGTAGDALLSCAVLTGFALLGAGLAALRVRRGWGRTVAF